MTWDWLFQPTDNINLIIEVGVGLTLTAWIAGQRAKERLVAYLKSEESNPVVDRLADRTVSKIPVVPDYSKLIHSEVNSAIKEAQGDMFQQLATRTGEQVRAVFASWKNEVGAVMRQASSATIASDPQGAMLFRLIANVTDKKTAETVMTLKEALKYMQMKGQGGTNGQQYPGQPQAQWQQGQRVTTAAGTFVLSGTEWIPVAALAAPPGPIEPPAGASFMPAEPDLPPKAAEARKGAEVADGPVNS